MPEPLLTFKLSKEFEKWNVWWKSDLSDEERVTFIKDKLYKFLPMYNLETLIFMVEFFNVILKYENKNRVKYISKSSLKLIDEFIKHCYMFCSQYF